MSSPRIVVENLTISYRHRPAVHHVGAVFDNGTMWALAGPNGAGKSTFLKGILGLVKIDSGSVVLEGMSRRDVAYLPQSADIDRSQPLSVFELVSAGLWYESGMFGGISAEQRDRVFAALSRTGMADFARRPIGRLSNGQFQRVLFARMLVQDARFLLLDEPFNAVDAATTASLMTLLYDEHARVGCSIVAVLHDMEQIRQYFDNTLLLAREAIAAGDTAQVLTTQNLQRAADNMQRHAANEWCSVSGSLKENA